MMSSTHASVGELFPVRAEYAGGPEVEMGRAPSVIVFARSCRPLRALWPDFLGRHQLASIFRTNRAAVPGVLR